MLHSIYFKEGLNFCCGHRRKCSLEQMCCSPDSRTVIDYLMKEIGQRGQKEPVKFRVVLQFAGPGDTLDDPSVVWPDSRQTAELGTVSLTHATTDETIDKSLVFLPNALPDGIQAADPMIDVRGAAYPVSFGRRQ